MQEFNCDLHYHGPFAGGVSKHMSIPIIAEQAQLKGLDLVVTSDSIHSEWLQHCKENLQEVENGIYAHSSFKTQFVVGTEVIDNHRVHHLIYLEDFTRAEELRAKLLPHGRLDGAMAGRPMLRLNGEQIAGIVEQVGGMIGPAHSFTPYFGILAHYNRISECYGELSKNVRFMELGLSADTQFADMIVDNHNYEFVCYSDSHSPWPHRIGREFTRMRMHRPSFQELQKVFERKGENKITLNAGLDPREGKYHATACNACYQHYSLDEAQKLNMRCSICKGSIKRGVRDRIAMLAGPNPACSPEWRPPYRHILALAEIIQITLEAKEPTSDKVQEVWKKFVDAFGTEIHALLDAPLHELREVDHKVAENIESFRNGCVVYYPGGGGKYGIPFICKNEEDKQMKLLEIAEMEKGKNKGQKTLGDF